MKMSYYLIIKIIIVSWIVRYSDPCVSLHPVIDTEMIKYSVSRSFPVIFESLNEPAG